VNPPGLAVVMGAVFFATMAGYALFAGADFGGGVWDLLAGGDEKGERPRAAIDASVTPVWEGNNVWIVLGLVIFWTAFPPAFGATFTALFVPLALSLLGILFRGIGFAFRHEVQRLPMKRLSGGLFAASSLMAPFFLGTAVGAIATGGVPAHPGGNVWHAWTNPTALVTGLLFVAACAYIGGVYLVADSDRRDQPAMVRYFQRRAVAAGVLTGALAGINMVLLHGSAPRLFSRLFGPALPAVGLSVVAGAVALVLIVANRPHLVRVAAALAVVGVVAGWGIAQYPELLPGELSLADGSAPPTALAAELVVMGLAALLVLPSFVYLYWLQQHERLQESESSDELQRAAMAANRAEDGAEDGAEDRSAGRAGTRTAVRADGGATTGAAGAVRRRGNPVIVVAVLGGAVAAVARELLTGLRRRGRRR
jgi:cytochrome bd ubiquinol oxidase subunit II